MKVSMQRIKIIALFVFLSIVPGLCAQQSVEAIFASRVSQQNLQRTVHDLVSFGNRLGGAASGNKAAQYLYTRFENYGYSPELCEDAEQLTYTNIHWKLQVDSPQTLQGLIQHEWLSGFSPSVPETVAPLRFVPTDKSNLDSLQGSVVLLDAQPTEKFYHKLVNAGAICIILFVRVNSPAYQHGAMIVQLPASNRNPIPMFSISRTAGERLLRELNKGTSITIRFSAETCIANGKPKTVIATLKGESEKYFIVCAHGDSDSGGPGADDNASGVSGTLEIARILQSMVKRGSVSQPYYTIRFIIWGTEYASATHYVKMHEDDLENIAGVINIDEIGIGRPRQCLYFEGNDVEHNKELLQVFQSIGEEYVGKPGYWKEATTNPCQGGTDSYVFLPDYLRRLRVRREKIPSITVFTAAWNEPKQLLQTPGWSSKAWKGNPDSVIIGYSPYYHSSLDIPALTTDKEPQKMIWGVKAVGMALLQIAWQN